MMKNRATSWGEDSPTPAQLKELFDQVKEGRITQQNLQRYLENPGIPYEHVSTIPVPFVKDWSVFCKEHLGRHVKIPKSAPRTNEPYTINLLIPEGLTIAQVLKLLSPQYKRIITSGIYIIKNERENDCSYFISTHNALERPSAYLRNINSEQIWDSGTETMTLLERLWFDYVVCARFGKHLDTGNIVGNAEWTQCSGTRLGDSLVPMVGCRRGELSISEIHEGRLSHRGHVACSNITSRLVMLS